MKTITADTTFEYNGLIYPVWDQTRLGSSYLAKHGCSFCALASMISALADPEITPVTLREDADKLLGLRSGGPQTVYGRTPGLSYGRARGTQHKQARDTQYKQTRDMQYAQARRPQYSRIQRAVQRKPAFDLLGWSHRMPLNIAGAVRILECYMDVEYLDGGSSEDLRSFILTKAGQGLPVIATGRYIPSISGDDLCPHANHTFLLVGMKDADTLIVLDSSGATKERIKSVRIDDLIRGIFRTGIRRGLNSRQYYFTPGTMGGVAAPRG